MVCLCFFLAQTQLNSKLNHYVNSLYLIFFLICVLFSCEQLWRRAVDFRTSGSHGIASSSKRNALKNFANSRIVSGLLKGNRIPDVRQLQKSMKLIKVSVDMVSSICVCLAKGVFFWWWRLFTEEHVFGVGYLNVAACLGNDVNAILRLVRNPVILSLSEIVVLVTLLAVSGTKTAMSQSNLLLRTCCWNSCMTEWFFAR